MSAALPDAEPQKFFKTAASFAGKKATHTDALVGFSEQQLRFLAESVPQIAWTALPDGYTDFMNSRWFEYSGLTAKETYEELKTAVHPDDLHFYKESWKLSVDTLKPYEVEYRFRRAADGMYRWHLGRAMPVMDLQGKVVRWFGTCTDIHEQKLAEEEVRRINESLETTVKKRTAHLQAEVERRRATEQQYAEQLMLLERMINTLPMAAAAVSSSGTILHVNAFFQTLFSAFVPDGILKHASASVLLRAAQTFFTFPDPEQFFELVRKGEAFIVEIKANDGRFFVFKCLPTNGDGGGYLLSLHDISNEKRVDSVKSEFMSLASHQLRTPLTSIRWALGRFSRSMADRMQPEEARLLAIMRESTSAMADTIRTMLSISRVEAGLHPATPTTFALGKFLEQFQDAFKDACLIKDLTFTLDCLADLSVYTDRLILREILENLLTNAIKYTPEGGSIHLRAWKDEKGISVQVEDTGVGIPEHQKEKVFTKFFRAENILILDMQGTGLGLYLVSQLIAVLEGTISFTSKLDEGTSFVLTLPAQTEA
jgi:PAS domain S-box-containing protein